MALIYAVFYIQDLYVSCQVHVLTNSWRPGDAYMHHQTRLSLVQTMACLLIDNRPFSEPMLSVVRFKQIHLKILSANFLARFLSLARSKLRLCLANHRAGYFSNLACD